MELQRNREIFSISVISQTTNGTNIACKQFNATRTVIQSAVKFPNSNIAIDFAETSLMLKKYVEVYLSIIKPTVK